MHDELRPFQGQRRVLQALLGQLNGAIKHFLGGHHVVDEAVGLRLGGLDLLAGEQKLHAVLAIDVAGEAHDAAGGGDDAEPHLGAAELRVLGGYHHVAGKRDLHAAAGRRAVAGADDRLGAEACSQAAEAVLGDGLALAALGELREVLAGAEHLAGARHDDGAYGLVALGVIHDVLHGRGGHAVERVGHFRTVDANDEQAVLAQLGYDGVGAKVVSHWFLLDSW